MNEKANVSKELNAKHRKVPNFFGYCNSATTIDIIFLFCLGSKVLTLMDDFRYCDFCYWSNSLFRLVFY